MAQARHIGRVDPRRRIVDAGRRLFFESGFVNVSTEDLAGAARVSKSTIYKYFGDMTGVLSAVAEAEADRFEFDEAAAPGDVGGFLDALTRFGAELLALINQPEKLQFDRLMLEQSRATPALAAAYYEATVARTQAHLADLIRHGQGLGCVARDADPTVLADHLLCMWQGLESFRARLGLTDRPIDDPQGWSETCVAALFGAGRRGSTSRSR